MRESNTYRRAMRISLVAAIGSFCAPFGLLAEPRTYVLPEETVRLLPGPGLDVAKVCTGCHSPDYVGTQPPHQGKAFWTAEVTKMKKVFGAPVEDADMERIIDYLTATY